MSKIITAIFICFISICSLKAQTKILEQDYYAFNKGDVIKFEQEGDTLQISRCTDLQTCKVNPRVKALILKDSVINKNTRKLVLENVMSKTNSVRTKEVVLIDYDNGRKGIDENYQNYINNKSKIVTLYPISELEKLKPIAQMSAAEAKDILNDFDAHVAAEDKKGREYDIENSTMFNNLVIAKGYSPVNADTEVVRKAE